MSFPTTTRVEVRGQGSAAWRAGEVTDDAAHGGSTWCVTLDTPINANAWGGRTRKYGGSELLSVVYINKNVEVMTPGEFIKAEGT